jgi:hypothetical protein
MPKLGQVVGVVFSAEEHLLAAIAALGDVMRNAGRDRSCQTSHAGT